MRRRSRALFAILPFLALGAAAGCGDETAATNGWTAAVDTLESGAVRVVHTPPEDAAPTWAFDPGLRIGAVDGAGPDVFGRVVDLAVGPDGRIAVLDGQAQEVRIFGPDGEHLRTFGGQGAGPGEFQGANGVVWGPDGLLRVADFQNTRLSRIDPDTGFVGSHPYQPMMFGSRWGGVVDAAGRSWSPHLRPAQNEGGERRTVYLGLDTAGAAVDSLPRYGEDRSDRAEGSWEIELGNERMLTVGVPGYPHAQVALDPQLRAWSTPAGDPAYRLIRWTADGDTALVLEARRPPVPTDRARTDSLVSGWEQRFGTRLDRSKIPDTAPAIHGFFFDDDGRLWVRARTAAGDSGTTLDAFDADSGDYLGTLAAPPELHALNPPPVIRGDTLWGVVRDELDVPTVVRGRIVDQDGGDLDDS